MRRYEFGVDSVDCPPSLRRTTPAHDTLFFYYTTHTFPSDQVFTSHNFYDIFLSGIFMINFFPSFTCARILFFFC